MNWNLSNIKKAIFICMALFFILLLAAVSWVGYQDAVISKRTPDMMQTADSALVLSTRVYMNGKPNPCLSARVGAAVELWRAGKVKKLVMSGGINRDFRHGSKTMQAMAEKMGVPASAIQQETEADDTFKNIVYSTPLLQDDHSVILVSSGFHMPRASWLAARQWPDKQIQVYAHHHNCYDNSGAYLLVLLREVGAIVKNGALDRY
ncbi:YdcF family protein [Neisseria zalophi]|uniref:YdcF family protein n=2 Tax=Neisseria zalophi TaxID=640030 RepID=A0A5J6PW84_9NEIS|nr:YdcF family protein [Neisseria zalophi]